MSLRWTVVGILAGLLVLSVVAYAGNDVVKNGSFDTPDPADASKPQDWTLQGQGAYLDGGHAGKCIMVKGSWSLYKQMIPVKPNTTYKVTCWLKGSVPRDLGQIVFGAIHNADKGWKDWDIYVRVAGDWTKFEKVITTPANCPAETDVSLLSEGCKGEIYFDDIAIEEM